MEIAKQEWRLVSKEWRLVSKIRFVMSFWMVYDIICIIMTSFTHLGMKMNKHRMEITNLKLCKAVFGIDEVIGAKVA